MCADVTVHSLNLHIHCLVKAVNCNVPIIYMKQVKRYNYNKKEFLFYVGILLKNKNYA